MSPILLLGVGIAAGMVGYYTFHNYYNSKTKYALLSSHDLTHGINKFYNPHYTHDPPHVGYRHPQDFSKPFRRNSTGNNHSSSKPTPLTKRGIGRGRGGVHHNQHQHHVPIGIGSIIGNRFAANNEMEQYDQHIRKLWNLDYGHAPVPHSHWELGPVPWVRDQQDSNDIIRNHAYSRTIPIPHQDILPGDVISSSNIPENLQYIPFYS